MKGLLWIQHNTNYIFSIKYTVLKLYSVSELIEVVYQSNLIILYTYTNVIVNKIHLTFNTVINVIRDIGILIIINFISVIFVH